MGWEQRVALIKDNSDLDQRSDVEKKNKSKHIARRLNKR